MGKPHKHAALIKAWADGAEIQCRTSEHEGWVDTDPRWLSYVEYRIKPKTVKYRNYLWQCNSSKALHVSTAYSDSVLNNGLFIKWLGDWQEVEV